jgi:AcrR family transcriptional regulator
MSYDADATRARILAAATKEFAALGVAGARVDRIAAEAKANKRAIYDYFGDKDGLFGAVLTEEMTRCAEDVRIVDADIADYAQRLFDYHTANPTTLRLLMWEALEFGERPVPAEADRAAKYRSRVESIVAGGVDEETAGLLVFVTLGLVNWGFAAPQLRRMILGDGYPADRLRRLVADAIQTLAKAAQIGLVDGPATE